MLMASVCYWLFTDSVLRRRGKTRFRKHGMRSGGVWQTDNATSHFSWSLTCWVLSTFKETHHQPVRSRRHISAVILLTFIIHLNGPIYRFPELHGITWLHMMGARVAVTSSSCLTVRSSCMRINLWSPAGRCSCVEEQAPASPCWTHFVLFGAVKCQEWQEWPSAPSCLDGDMVLHIKGPRAHFTLWTLCSVNV